MDYAFIVGLLGIFSAITWRVTFVLTRSMQRSQDEFKAFTAERFARQDEALAKQGEAMKEGFARQDEALAKQGEAMKEGFARRDEAMKEGFAKQEKRLDRHEALLVGLAREVSLLTGALMGVPTHPRDREKVGSRD